MVGVGDWESACGIYLPGQTRPQPSGGPELADRRRQLVEGGNRRLRFAGGDQGVDLLGVHRAAADETPRRHRRERASVVQDEAHFAAERGQYGTLPANDEAGQSLALSARTGQLYRRMQVTADHIGAGAGIGFGGRNGRGRSSRATPPVIARSGATKQSLTYGNIILNIMNLAGENYLILSHSIV